MPARRTACCAAPSGGLCPAALRGGTPESAPSLICRGSLSRPIPPAFLQQLRQQAAAAAARGDSRLPAAAAEADDRDEDGSGEEGGGRRPAAAAGQLAGSQGRRPTVRVNQLARQRWLFRRALVRALLLLQQRQVGTAAVAATPADDDAPAAKRPAGKRRAAAEAGAAAGSQLQWHPGFDPAGVTAERLAAAGEQLAAPARAQAAAAEREAADADALAAARRLARSSRAPSPAAATASSVVGGSSTADGASAGGGQRRVGAAARPPQLMKQYAPCTDTSELGPAAFLEHLQGRPWYRGQLVHTEQLPARAAQHAAPAAPLAPPVAAALRLRGVDRLFRHQAAAIDLLFQVGAARGRSRVCACQTQGQLTCALALRCPTGRQLPASAVDSPTAAGPAHRGGHKHRQRQEPVLHRASAAGAGAGTTTACAGWG